MAATRWTSAEMASLIKGLMAQVQVYIHFVKGIHKGRCSPPPSGNSPPPRGTSSQSLSGGNFGPLAPRLPIPLQHAGVPPTAHAALAQAVAHTCWPWGQSRTTRDPASSTPGQVGHSNAPVPPVLQMASVDPGTLLATILAVPSMYTAQPNPPKVDPRDRERSGNMVRIEIVVLSSDGPI